MHSFWRQAAALAGSPAGARGDWLARSPYHPYHDWMKVAPPARWAAWFRDRSFYQAPLYSYCLAVLMRVSGDAAFWARLAQLVLGVVNCALIYALTRRVFGRGAALAAGLIVAVYGPLLIVESQLLRETAILSLTLAIFYGYAAAQSRGRVAWKRAALGLGVLLGILAMLHEGAALLGLAIGWAGMLHLRRRAGRWRASSGP